MTFNYNLKTILVLLLVVTISSCVKDVDFNQAESIVLSPTMDISLIHFNEPATNFIDDIGTEITVKTDSVAIDIFTDDFVVDNLIKADFLFEATNTINRSFQAQIDFFDAQNQIAYTFTFNVPSAINNDEIIAEHIEVFENQSLTQLKQTTRLQLTLTMLPSTNGSTLNNGSQGSLKFKSKGTFYLNINTAT